MTNELKAMFITMGIIIFVTAMFGLAALIGPVVFLIPAGLLLTLVLYIIVLDTIERNQR